MSNPGDPDASGPATPAQLGPSHRMERQTSSTASASEPGAALSSWARLGGVSAVRGDEEAGRAILSLLELMRTLRDPKVGCPWDREQTFETIAPYTIEEAYEVADAISRQDMADLRTELGDLLFQVVFHAQMAREADAFDFTSVAQTLDEKMRARHPHVFAAAETRDVQSQTTAWEAQKADERRAKFGAEASVLADVPLAAPALARAAKLTKRAARIGFDWPDADSVLAKLDEELAELHEARRLGDEAGIAEELGDILFVLANLARKLDVDPEDALRQANAKFVRRFTYVETRAPKDAPASLEALEALWQEAKMRERAKG